MKDFNAQKARELANSVRLPKELDGVLFAIEVTAKKGLRTFNIYNRMNPETVQSLKDLGYNVADHGQVAIQKDGLYHTITW